MNDPKLTMDRMVDGELSRAEERTLLLDCESNNRWRELALAFVEARALQDELRGFLVNNTPNQPIVAATLPRSDAQRPIGHQAKHHDDHHAEKDCPPQQRTQNTPNWRTWFALAATVLLALSVGFGVGGIWNRSPSPSEFTSHAPENVPSNARPFRSMQFMVNHPNNQELQQIEIPVFDVKDLGPNWQQRLQANSWDRLVEEMRQQGLHLRQQRTLTPVRMPDGQRVVVPVDYFIEQPYQ